MFHIIKKKQNAYIAPGTSTIVALSMTDWNIPAVFVGQSVQSDRPLTTGTFEEAFDGVVPPQTVVLVHAAIGRLEVRVVTLETRRNTVNTSRVV